MKYIPKPIEAYQFNWDNREFFIKRIPKSYIHSYYLMIPTDKGIEQFHQGDYLIQKDDKFEIMERRQFESLYEPDED